MADQGRRPDSQTIRGESRASVRVHTVFILTQRTGIIYFIAWRLFSGSATHCGMDAVNRPDIGENNGADFIGGYYRAASEGAKNHPGGGCINAGRAIA